MVTTLLQSIVVFTWSVYIRRQFNYFSYCIPQSYCINLVSGNWKHLLVAIGCNKVAGGDRWVENISSIIFILWWAEGLGWLMDISSGLVNTFGTNSTNLYSPRSWQRVQLKHDFNLLITACSIYIYILIEVKSMKIVYMYQH